jgi:hypothetical protein
MGCRGWGGGILLWGGLLILGLSTDEPAPILGFTFWLVYFGLSSYLLTPFLSMDLLSFTEGPFTIPP